MASSNPPSDHKPSGSQNVDRPKVIEPEFERIIAWTGTLNFRDLGGYRSVDGRTTRWRTLYRSGTTHEMGTEEVAQMLELGIRYVFDLRSRTERADSPSPLESLAALSYRAADHDQIPGDITRTLKSPQTTASESRRVMIAAYRHFPLLFKDAYRQLFLCLENRDLPMLVNCSAGKDRTGVAMALVQSALGIPRSTILEDYLLTERSFDQCCALFMRSPLAAIFADTDQVIWEPVLRADAAYLEAMFDSVEERFNSVEDYFRDALGIREDALQRIRGHLLE